MKNLAALLVVFSQLAALFTWILAPLVGLAWLLFAGAWSPLLLVLMSSLFALALAYAILFVSGFFGPIGVIVFPILGSAYVQCSFLQHAEGRHDSSLAVPLLLCSVMLSSIPTSFLGKGFELQFGVMVFRGTFAISFCIAALLFGFGYISAPLHFIGVHLAGLILGCILNWIFGSAFEEVSLS